MSEIKDPQIDKNKLRTPVTAMTSHIPTHPLSSN